MSALVISLAGLLLMIGGAVAGAGLRAVLPEHHLSKDSREIVNLCIGVVATMAALVLGLLIASAKDSFDSKVRETQQIAVSVVLLEQALRQYGPESAAARKQLLAATTATLLHATTRGDAPLPATPLAARASLQALQLAVLALTPANESQHWLRANVLTLVGNMAQATEMLNMHEGSSLPMPFLVILVCWLVIIFGSLALFAPTNATVRAVLFVCALSTSGAIFLILEMDRPFDGWIQISTEPLSNALAMARQ
jgi:cytochrome bd-type quinol oxidase subunit 2